MNTQKKPPVAQDRRAVRAVAAAVTALVTTVGLAALPLASASATARTDATIGDITVTPTSGLPEEGAVVTVTGTGFDTAAGIYVAVCVDNGPGVKPSPCIGGIDTTGAGGATWISDTPPSYAEGLTQPYGPGGSFTLDLPVPMVDPVTGTDCRVVTCAVTTRYDHTRGEDRGADNVVPLTFGGDASAPIGAAAEADADAGDELVATEEPAPTDAAATPGTPASDEVSASDAADTSTSDEETGGAAVPLAVGAAAVVVLGAVALLVARRRRDAAQSLSPAQPGMHDDS